MCGIIGAVASRDVTPILFEGLKRLEYRGYDSAGIAVLNPKREAIDCRRRAGKVKDLVSDLGSTKPQGTIGIAHTRWATHGQPSEQNAHPQTSSGRVSVVHNGIVENYEELRRDMANAGYAFESETDTEVIAHLVDFYYDKEKGLLDAVRQAAKRLDGAYAIGVIALANPNTIVAARVGSPLVIGKGIGENFIASDPLALRPVTDRFIFLEEGDLVELTSNDISIWNLADESVIRSTVRVELADEAEKGSYRHYMQKEIYEQEMAITATLEGRLVGKQLLEEAFGVSMGETLDKTKALTIVACGSSYYAAQIAKYWIEEIAGIPCHAEVASEYRYRQAAVIPGTLFVTISQSGETADTLAALTIAKQKPYVGTLALCNVPNSTLARESDLVIMTKAGTEIGVASTKAFTTQLVDLAMLAILVARRHGLNQELEEDLVAALTELPGLAQEALNLDGTIKEISKRLAERHHALFLGRGLMFPIAMEGALKLKEIAYIHAEGYAAGELKHGPLALVDEDVPVIAVAPNDQLLEKVKSNLQEVKARGGELIVFADRQAGFKDAEGVTVVQLPPVHLMMSPVLYVIALQLLAYHVAVLKGTDVDQPRNLAKSVTVE